MRIYLDNAATTKPCDECVQAIHDALTENYGNASSLHGLGVSAMKELISAREIIAKSIDAHKDDLFFTSGGTEANNLAILGTAYANRRKGNRIVTTAIEHESVLAPINKLEEEGFEVIRLEPDKFGRITEQQISNAINSDTILVSIMLINNEIGSIMPVSCISRAVKKAGAPALIHVDCVQGYGKTPIRVKKLGADLITITAHKIHGPKGIGALYIKKGVRILPRTFGGDQEKKIRPGTESVPLIAGFAAAVAALPPMEEQTKKTEELNAYARTALHDIGSIEIHCAPDASPYILNIYIPGFMRSQTIIQELSAKYGICVSSGSACAKGKRSHVLTAMRLDDEKIDKSLRISFSRDTTKGDIDSLQNALKELMQKNLD